MHNIDDSELPLLASTFNGRMLAHRPPSTTISLARTSFKKLGVFLRHMATQEAAIELSETSPGVLAIARVCRDQADYIATKRAAAIAAVRTAAPAPHTVRQLVSATMEQQSSVEQTSSSSSSLTLSSSSSSSSSSSFNDSSSTQAPTFVFPRLSIVLLPPKALAAWLPTDAKLCSDVEADTAIVRLLADANVTTRVGKQTVTLRDDVVARLVTSALAIDASATPVTRRAVTNALRALFVRAWTIIDARALLVEPKLHTSALPRVRVEEARVRNKNVTLVLRLVESFGVTSLEQVAHAWRAPLAAGVAVGSHGGNNAVDNAIVVQGFRTVELVTLLKRDFGAVDEMIDVVTAVVNKRR